MVNWAKSFKNKRVLPKRSRKARLYQGRGAVSRGKLGKIVQKQESFAQKEKKRETSSRNPATLPANPQNNNELIAQHKQNQKDVHLFHK